MNCESIVRLKEQLGGQHDGSVAILSACELIIMSKSLLSMSPDDVFY